MATQWGWSAFVARLLCEYHKVFIYIQLLWLTGNNSLYNRLAAWEYSRTKFRPSPKHSGELMSFNDRQEMSLEAFQAELSGVGVTEEVLDRAFQAANAVLREHGSRAVLESISVTSIKDGETMDFDNCKTICETIKVCDKVVNGKVQCQTKTTCRKVCSGTIPAAAI